MIQLPDKINIMGTPYTVVYCEKASDVDSHGKEALWGHIDYWDCVIRALKGNRPTVEIWKTLMHEILHGIANSADITCLKDKANHDELDVLAEILTDTLIRNGWLQVEENECD